MMFEPSPNKLYLFGIPRLERDGKPVKFARRKALALLAYLALHPVPHLRDVLAAMFWGDSDCDAARLSLRVAVSELRKVVGEQVLRIERDAIQMALDFSLWVDVREFQRHGAASDWQAALDLYAGEFLPDVHEDWVREWREQLRQAYLEALLRLVERQRIGGAQRTALELANCALRCDPGNENAHRQIMLCYDAMGERAAAIMQYEICVASMRESLGVGPSAATRGILQRLQNTPTRSAGLTPHLSNLPTRHSSFIARAREQEEIENRLVPTGPVAAARLITLTGCGGSGKTRLAIEAATELVNSYQDGVWWVDLSSLRHPWQVLVQIAKVCGVDEDPSSDALERRLLAALQMRHCLIVLDNCEHLIVACAELARRILVTCTRTQMLATSREALGVSGEQIYLLPPLDLPTRQHSHFDAATHCNSVCLFVQRAQAQHPGFKLDPSNFPIVSEICRKLDGIPLAIELAAARLRNLTVEQIADGLDDRFAILVSDDKSVLARQRTLWALIDWSYQLLHDDERELLLRLARLPAACALEQVEEVGDGLPVFDLLGCLVDKSLLLARETPEGMYYQMLDSIRVFVLRYGKQSGAVTQAKPV